VEGKKGLVWRGPEEKNYPSVVGFVTFFYFCTSLGVFENKIEASGGGLLEKLVSVG
jgi:hypothetical protein